MALPKGPLLAPIGRNMQEVAIADIAKEIAAEFQKTVPMNVSHTVTVDPIQIEGLEDSNDADRIVEALNAIKAEDPDNVRVDNEFVNVKEIGGDAERTDAPETQVSDGDRENVNENMLSILESIDKNTNDTVEALLDVEHAIRETGTKSKEDKQDEDEEKRKKKQGTGRKSGKQEGEKEGKESKGLIGRMFERVTKWFKGIFTMMNVFFLAVGAIVASLLTSGGIEVAKNLKEVFGTFVNEVIPTLLEAVANIAQALTPLFVMLAEMAGSIVATLAPIVTNLVQTILPPLMTVVQSLATAFAGLVAAVMPVVTFVLEAILPPLTQMLTGLLELFSNLVTIIMPPLAVVIGILGFAITRVVNGLLLVVNTFNLIFGVLFSIKDGFDSLGDNLKLAFGKFINGIIDMGLNLLGWIPGTDSIAEKMRGAKIDTGAIEERIENREAAQVNSKAEDAIEEGEIDMDAPYAEVKSAVEAQVAKRAISKEVGEAILMKKEEKDVLEGSNPTIDPDAPAVLTMSDLFGPSQPQADREFVSDMNMLPAEQQQLLASDPTTPASNVNVATTASEEAKKDIDTQPPSESNPSFNSLNNSTQIAQNNITTGVIGTGGESSLGHRHRRILPGVA